jgi:hypothetical protein
MVMPKLGSQFPGTAKPNALIEVCSNSWSVLEPQLVLVHRRETGGIPGTPSGSSAVATYAPPRPSVRALV